MFHQVVDTIITLFPYLCGIFCSLFLFYLWQRKKDKKEVDRKIKAYDQYKKEMLREKFHLIGEMQKQKQKEMSKKKER